MTKESRRKLMIRLNSEEKRLVKKLEERKQINTPSVPNGGNRTSKNTGAAKGSQAKTKNNEFFRDLSVKIPRQTGNQSAISPTKLRNTNNSSSPCSMQKIKIKQKIAAGNERRLTKITPTSNLKKGIPKQVSQLSDSSSP